ncbi:MAG: hypothetical protein GY937_03890 [bacterium]|nr:hypothetical protein [bacterium]
MRTPHVDGSWRHSFAGCTVARSEVRTALRRSACIALSGPEGIGKTCLLQDLAAVTGGAFRVAYLPLAALPARELAAWALGAMDEEMEGDPGEALLTLANRPGEPPLLLAIDEAHAMPPASARQLAEWLDAAKGRLALVAAFNPDPRTPRVRLALGGERVDVAFERPLTPDEARAFVLEFVERTDPLPSRRARFDETTLAGLFATSGGLPGRLLDLACHVLEGGPAPGADGNLSLAEDFDPFSVTATADAYVARPATEHTLAALERELAGDAPLLSMIGPPGIGKTQILRVLAGRLTGRFQTLHVAYGSLEPDELERWIAALLGATAGTGALLEHARNAAAAGTPFLLMLDDAGAVPDRSLEWLHGQVVASEGALRIIFAATDSGGDRPLAALEALDPAPRRIPLTDPLDADESEAWVSARLRAAAAPEPMRRVFDARTVRDLHQQAGGNPAELGRLANERVREHAASPGPLDAQRERPTARDRESASQPLSLRGGTGWLLLGGLTLVALLAFLLPAVTDWSPSNSAPVAASEQEVSVHINATPWAHVMIDGRELGTTPLGNVPLTVGSHALRAELADGTIIEREIEIDANHRHVVITR